MTPTAPAITAGSVIEMGIGFNGTNLVLTGPGAQQGHCVDALGQSLIGQVSACDAVQFYNMANADIAKSRDRRLLHPDPAGEPVAAAPCFMVVGKAISAER